MPARLTEEEFARHVNTPFRVQADDQNFELQLVEVKGYQPKPHEQKGLERFSVFFDGPNHYLPQNVYSLQHKQMGEFEIFLVPIARRGEQFRYEAVFNFRINEDEI